MCEVYSSSPRGNAPRSGEPAANASALVEDAGLVLGGEAAPPRPRRRIRPLVVHHASIEALAQRCTRQSHGNR